ncbi:hypothetical protein IT575_15595 [bacterium]|nr:hypothetical protein [bacterium]
MHLEGTKVVIKSSIGRGKPAGYLVAIPDDASRKQVGVVDYVGLVDTSLSDLWINKKSVMIGECKYEILNAAIDDEFAVPDELVTQSISLVNRAGGYVSEVDLSQPVMDSLGIGPAQILVFVRRADNGSLYMVYSASPTLDHTASPAL